MLQSLGSRKLISMLMSGLLAGCHGHWLVCLHIQITYLSGISVKQWPCGRMITLGSPELVVVFEMFLN